MSINITRICHEFSAIITGHLQLLAAPFAALSTDQDCTTAPIHRTPYLTARSLIPVGYSEAEKDAHTCGCSVAHLG